MKKLFLFLLSMISLIASAQDIPVTGNDSIVKITITKVPRIKPIPQTVTVIDKDTVYLDTCSTAPVNQPPSANAGVDKTITLPTNTVSLTGTGSDDGLISSYEWDMLNGPSVVIFSSPNTANTNVTNLVKGVYTFRLMVTDNKGATGVDSVRVTVNAAAPPDPGGSTFNFSFSQLTGDYSRPESGAENWYNNFQVPISNVTASDRYIRFNWAGLNPGQGQYDWSLFDKEINTAIDAKQGFSFGIMTQYLGGKGSVGNVTIDGKGSAYPAWLHSQMMNESVKPFLDKGPDGGGNDWVPVWNSPTYLKAFEDFLSALNDHLQKTTYKGVLYKNVIVAIDIRGYGNFGEFHCWPYGDGPSTATRATTATLKRIIDAHKNAFNDFRLVAMISGMGDSWSAANAEISYYLLTLTTKTGPAGIRRDNWGATEDWYNKSIWENNSRTYNGIAIKTLIMEKYKTAPITGEPCCANGYTALPAQVALYHVNSFGNGNMGGQNNASIVNASKAAGARVTLTGGSATAGVGKLAVTINWNNTGVAAIYRDWNVVYKIKSGNTVVKSFTSAFNPKLFTPGTKTSTDQLSDVPAGTYTLTIEMTDPAGYRSPYPFGITGRNTDGSYNLSTIKIQ